MVTYHKVCVNDPVGKNLHARGKIHCEKVAMVRSLLSADKLIMAAKLIEELYPKKSITVIRVETLKGNCDLLLDKRFVRADAFDIAVYIAVSAGYVEIL